MVVMRVAVVVAMAVTNAVTVAVQALDIQGRRVELVLRAGHVNMGVCFFGTAKQQARFGGGEVRQDLRAADKSVGQMFEAVSAHHRVHHFGFNGQRDVHLVVLGDGFPVLIAQRVTQFEAGLDQDVHWLLFEFLEVNDHHVTQVQLHDHRGAGGVVP